MVALAPSIDPRPYTFRGSFYLFSPLVPLVPVAFWQLVIAAPFIVLLAFVGLSMLPIPTPGLLTAMLVYLHLQPTRILLGHDGIAVSWIFPTTFYPHADIVHAVLVRNGVELRLRGGRTVKLASSQASQVLGMWRMITEASSSAPRLSPDAVAPRGRSAREWLLDVGAVGKSLPEAYREAALRPDDLWELAENPRIPLEARVGAAMALRRSMDDSGRMRLRVAAASCVSRPLSAALYKAADPDASELDLEKAARDFSR